MYRLNYYDFSCRSQSHPNLTADSNKSVKLSNTMKQIYTLQLEHGCWYVGCSNNWMERFKAHKEGRGASWTRLHRPIKCVSHTRGDEGDEELATLRLMARYGVDVVRGGAYTTPELSPAVEGMLEDRCRSLRGECYKCGSSSHYAKDCLSGTYCDCCCYQDGKNIKHVSLQYEFLSIGCQCPECGSESTLCKDTGQDCNYGISDEESSDVENNPTRIDPSDSAGAVASTGSVVTSTSAKIKLAPTVASFFSHR